MPTPHPDFMVNGKPGTLEKIDDVTVVFEFPEPNYLFLDILAGCTAMGGGQATQQYEGRSMGAYMPAHYLKQFHPKYIGMDELDAKAKAAGFDGWISLHQEPVGLAAQPRAADADAVEDRDARSTRPTWVLERNPFYYGVDTAGNQLPYLDRISMTLAENLEVLNLRPSPASTTSRSGTPTWPSCPVFLENRDKGNYDVRLDPALNGSDATLQTNQAYEARPRDREVAPQPRLPPRAVDGHRPRPAQRDVLARHRRARLGRAERVHAATAPARSGARSGRRSTSSRPTTCSTRSASTRRTARATGCAPTARAGCASSCRPSAGAFIPHTQIAEMIKEQWKKIGIQADVKELERSLFFTRDPATSTRSCSGPTTAPRVLYLFPRHALPVDPVRVAPGPSDRRLVRLRRQAGQGAQDAELLKALELFRSAGGKKSEERVKIAQEIWKIMVDEQYSHRHRRPVAGHHGRAHRQPKLGNVPSRQINAQHCRTPGTSQPATFYYKA